MIDKNPLYEEPRMPDGIFIKTARLEPEATPVGVVHIIHGFGEHIGLYLNTAKFFTKNNFACVIHDQRGFGERRGMTEKERNRENGVISGHSMGGNVAINYLLKRSQEEYSKAVFETPWLRLYKKMPDFVVLLARVLGKLNHKFALVNKLDLNDITRARDAVDALSNDKYYHNRISFLLFSQITTAGEYALNNAGDIKIPALLLCAGNDKIVCPKAIREFAKNATDNVIFKEYADGYHALHSDTCKDKVLEEVVSFLKSTK